MEAFHAVGSTVWGIPSYFFFTGIALLFSVCTFISLITDKNYPLKENTRILMYSFFAAIVSARLFGAISGVYRDIGLGVEVTWESAKNAGIVYYGGLLGGGFAFSRGAKSLPNNRHTLDILAVCIPLFHVFGRIGCFYAGCCFGVEHEGRVAVYYTTRVLNEVVTANRVPVQLLEAMFNLVLFFYLFSLLRKEDWKSKNLWRTYLFTYSVGRFILEFFRGDLERGVIYGVSFSQVVSVCIWMYLLATSYLKKSEHPKVT